MIQMGDHWMIFFAFSHWMNATIFQFLICFSSLFSSEYDFPTSQKRCICIFKRIKVCSSIMSPILIFSSLLVRCYSLAKISTWNEKNHRKKSIKLLRVLFYFRVLEVLWSPAGCLVFKTKNNKQNSPNKIYWAHVIKPNIPNIQPDLPNKIYWN